jgi:hypothetical protein
LGDKGPGYVLGYRHRIERSSEVPDVAAARVVPQAQTGRTVAGNACDAPEHLGASSNYTIQIQDVGFRAADGTRIPSMPISRL